MVENRPLRDGAMQANPEVDVDDDAIFKDPPEPASQPTRGRGSNRKGRACGSTRGSARGDLQPSIQRKAS